jgi:hypothetical protein
MKKAVMPLILVGIVALALSVGYLFTYHFAPWLGERIADKTHRDTVAVLPGPVEPVPRIEDHAAAVMAQERQGNLTWTSLRRDYGVTLLCSEMLQKYGTGVPTNPWNVTTYTPCSRIDAIEVDGQRVWTRGK